jgi:ketosteroid isomerase-like protein
MAALLKDSSIFIVMNTTLTYAFRYFVSRLCIMILILTSSSSFAQSTDETAIRQVLSEQSKAWNKGDIDSYMKGYWNSDSLVFIGKNGPKYGYKTTLENYKKSYPNTSAMGKLTFNLLQLKPLSANYYSIIGEWHLQRTIGDLQGYFTLLFEKINNKWVIIMDHSS